jgi:hypothetical protein
LVFGRVCRKRVNNVRRLVCAWVSVESGQGGEMRAGLAGVTMKHKIGQQRLQAGPLDTGDGGVIGNQRKSTQQANVQAMVFFRSLIYHRLAPCMEKSCCLAIGAEISW